MVSEKRFDIKKLMEKLEALLELGGIKKDVTLLEDHSVSLLPMQAAEQALNAGSTVTYLAVDGRFAGALVLADTLRPDSEQMLSRLKELSVQPVLLTGDHEAAANTIAAKVGMQDVRAGCLPEDKLRYIDDFQKAGSPVCMIGDGVNDAPALKKAAVGIAMGGVGSDIAVDAADIALVDDEIRELPHLVALSKRMMTTVKLNMTFSMTLNFIAIILAMTGTLSPVVGALVHNAGSVLVITNSVFLLNWRKKAWQLKFRVWSSVFSCSARACITSQRKSTTRSQRKSTPL